MAQPGEARTISNPRVGIIQKRIVGAAVACMAIGFIAFLFAQLQVHAWRQPEPRPASLSVLHGIEEVFFVLACLAFFAGRGLLMCLRPRDVQGQLRAAAARTGHPRLYGLVMVWLAATVVSAWGLLELQAYQTSMLDNSALSIAIYWLALSSILPMLAIELFGVWRRHIEHGAQG